MQLLVLLIIANGAPVLARLLLREKLDWPLDLGRNFSDGRPLLGPGKTFRGVVAALLTTSLFAILLDLPFLVGVLVGLGAMVGDALSSFIKRRLGVAPHTSLLGVDQIPESLLPLILVQPILGADNMALLGILLAFCIAELGLSWLLAVFERGRD